MSGVLHGAEVVSVGSEDKLSGVSFFECARGRWHLSCKTAAVAPSIVAVL